MKRIFIFLISIIFCLNINIRADWEIYCDFEFDGVYYEILSPEDHTLAVVGFSDDCPDNCIIPDILTFNSLVYKVTAILGSRITDSSPPDFRFDYFNAGSKVPKILTLPGSITEMGYGIFFMAPQLEEVSINEGVSESLWNSAFSGCYASRINLPNNFKHLGDGAFYGSMFLRQLNLPTSLESIGAWCFSGVGNGFLPEYWPGPGRPIPTSTSKDLILPNTLTHIGTGAFYDAYWNHMLVLPDAIEIIPENAFSFTELEELIVPNNVKEIQSRAFNTFISYHVDTGINWDNWEWPKNLKRLTLGTSIESIAKDAFGESLELKEFYCLPSTPVAFVFSGFNPDATVLVPPGKLDTYKNAKGWNHFKNFRELPNVLIQFQIKKYFLASEESAELRYIVSNLTDANIVSEEWTIEDSNHNPADDALAIEDGYVKGLQSGDYYLTLTLTDDAGEQYSATAVVLVDSNGSGVEEIYGDDTQENSDLTKVYNLQGTFVGTSTCGLAPGLYIVKDGSDTKKVLIK